MQYLLSWLIVLGTSSKINFIHGLPRVEFIKPIYHAKIGALKLVFHLNSTLNVHLNIKEKCTLKYAFSQKKHTCLSFKGGYVYRGPFL